MTPANAKLMNFDQHIRMMTDIKPGAETIDSLKLFVNGEELRARSLNLQALLEELGYKSSSIATAINGDFIAMSSRANTLLKTADRIEIVSARQGG